MIYKPYLQSVSVSKYDDTDSYPIVTYSEKSHIVINISHKRRIWEQLG